MADLSPYELRVLRHAATGEDQELVPGAALWALWKRLRQKASQSTRAGRLLDGIEHNGFPEVRNG
jgi:hypothetical protein